MIWSPAGEGMGERVLHDGMIGRVWPLMAPTIRSKPESLKPTGKFGATVKDRITYGPRYYRSEAEAKFWVEAVILGQIEADDLSGQNIEWAISANTRLPEKKT